MTAITQKQPEVNSINSLNQLSRKNVKSKKKVIVKNDNNYMKRLEKQNGQLSNLQNEYFNYAYNNKYSNIYNKLIS